MDLTVQSPLDRPPDQCRRVGAVELVDRDNSGGRGDVDLGQPAPADDIDSDEQQPSALELGGESGANLLLARGQLGLSGGAADGKVRADFALAGDAIDRAGDFTVDQHDALMP